jgi:hypothetical protein
MKKEKTVTISRIVKQTVTFSDWDFETTKEFDKFVLKLKSDEEYMLDHFYDNLDDEHYEMIKDVFIED